MPWQINARHFGDRGATENGDARVSRILKIDGLFKVEPPLPLHWLNAAWNSSRRVCPRHFHLLGQLVCNVFSTRALRSFVCLLKRQHIDFRQESTMCKGVSGFLDIAGNELRSIFHAHHSNFSNDASADEVRSACVTDVV